MDRGRWIPRVRDRSASLHDKVRCESRSSSNRRHEKVNQQESVNQIVAAFSFSKKKVEPLKSKLTGSKYQNPGNADTIKKKRKCLRQKEEEESSSIKTSKIPDRGVVQAIYIENSVATKTSNTCACLMLRRYATQNNTRKLVHS